MIPANRPVLGKDLETVQHAFGMLVADACWVFGLSITKWMHIVRQAPDQPLRDPSMALLARFLSDHPELNIVPTFPTAPEMFEFINDVQPVDHKRFAVMFGSEASSTYRWLKPGSRMSPTVARLMYYMRMAMLAAEPEERENILTDWRKTVVDEGQSRGVIDVFASGAWTFKEKKRRAPRKKKTEPAPADPFARKAPARKKAVVA